MDDNGEVTNQFHHIISKAQLVEKAKMAVAKPVALWYKQWRLRALVLLICLPAIITKHEAEG